MNRNVIFGIIALILLVAGGVWLYDWVLGEPESASAPIAATPVVLNTQTPTEALAVEAPPTTQPEKTPTDPPAAGNSENAVNSPEGFIILAIVPEETEARFNIYELLNGQDKDVVGTTNQVAGEVAINPVDMSQVQFGAIQVNARTFRTDESRRNNAIRNRILNTDQYEFVTFTPTSVSGLSGTGQVGQSYTFQVTGDLTIRDVTHPVTFDITLLAETETRLTGSASASIKRSDFNLIIPSVPFVANVADEFTLELDLVMAPVTR